MHKITQTWKGRESQVTYNLFLRGPALQSPKPMLSEYGISKHLNCISKSWQSNLFPITKQNVHTIFPKVLFFVSKTRELCFFSLCF